MRSLLGIDLGTQSVKAVLLREDGHLLGISSGSYPILTPVIGHAEQAPSSWWQAVIDCIKNLLAEVNDKYGTYFSHILQKLLEHNPNNRVISSSDL